MENFIDWILHTRIGFFVAVFFVGLGIAYLASSMFTTYTPSYIGNGIGALVGMFIFTKKTDPWGTEPFIWVWNKVVNWLKT